MNEGYNIHYRIPFLVYKNTLYNRYYSIYNNIKDKGKYRKIQRGYMNG